MAKALRAHARDELGDFGNHHRAPRASRTDIGSNVFRRCGDALAYGFLPPIATSTPKTRRTSRRLELSCAAMELQMRAGTLVWHGASIFDMPVLFPAVCVAA